MSSSKVPGTGSLYSCLYLSIHAVLVTLPFECFPSCLFPLCQFPSQIVIISFLGVLRFLLKFISYISFLIFCFASKMILLNLEIRLCYSQIWLIHWLSLVQTSMWLTKYVVVWCLLTTPASSLFLLIQPVLCSCPCGLLSVPSVRPVVFHFHIFASTGLSTCTSSSLSEMSWT